MYSWINDVEGFKRITKQWDESVLASADDNPFLLSGFILTWCKYYLGDYKLRVFVVYQNGNIVAGIPLYQSNNGYLEYPGKISANYTEFLVLDRKQPFWEYFFEALRDLQDWKSLALKRFRKERADLDHLKLVMSSHKDILCDVYNHDCGYLIDIPDNLQDYFKILGKKVRYYLRRSEKGLSDLGRISLRSLDNLVEISELTDKYIALSKASFRKRGKESAFDDPRYCAFFKELITSFKGYGYLDANALMLDDKIIAIHFGYSIGNNLNYIFPTFDIEFAGLNPGHLLIYKLLELAIKRKNGLFNLYTGSHLYKEQWSNRREEIVSIEIRRNCLCNRIGQKITGSLRTSQVTGRLKRNIISYPALLKLGRKIKESIHSCV